MMINRSNTNVKNYMEVSREIRNTARFVCMIIEEDKLQQIKAGKYKIKTMGTLGQVMQSHNDEAFINEPKIACLGTGFAISSNCIVTAAHVFSNFRYLLENAKNNPVRFVFSFHHNEYGELKEEIREAQVFSFKEVIGSTYYRNNNAKDFTLLSVNERIPANRIVSHIRTTGKIDDRETVFAIGHPRGLPLKISGNAHVTFNEEAPFFYSNIHTHIYGSGSPVFSTNTTGQHLLEGMVVGGEGAGQDFKPAMPGRKLHGRRVLRMTQLIPELTDNHILTNIF